MRCTPLSKTSRFDLERKSFTALLVDSMCCLLKVYIGFVVGYPFSYHNLCSNRVPK